jgi:hypothetical protein
VLHYRRAELRVGCDSGVDNLLPSIAMADLAHALPMADLRPHLATLHTELGRLINRTGGEEARGGAGRGRGDIAGVPVLAPALGVLVLPSRSKLGASSMAEESFERRSKWRSTSRGGSVAVRALVHEERNE